MRNLSGVFTKRIQFQDPIAPLEVSDYTIVTKRGQLFSTLLLHNISTKDIAAAKVTLLCLDAFGEKVDEKYIVTVNIEMIIRVGERKHTYLFRVPNPKTRRFNVIVAEVAFSDSDVWIRGDYPQIESFASSPGGATELTMLQTVAGPYAANYYAEKGDYWECVCGRINISQYPSCQRCKTDRQSLKQIAVNCECMREAYQEICENNKKHNRLVITIMLSIIIVSFISTVIYFVIK